jgi:hypothetical protein
MALERISFAGPEILPGVKEGKADVIPLGKVTFWAVRGGEKVKMQRPGLGTSLESNSEIYDPTDDDSFLRQVDGVLKRRGKCVIAGNYSWTFFKEHVVFTGVLGEYRQIA